MFFNFNYKSINLRDRFCFLAVILFSIFIFSGLFFALHNAINEDIDYLSNRGMASPPMPKEADPNFLTQVNECFIPVAAAYGYTLRITDAFRRMEEQNGIYQQGRTVNGHIVTEAPAGKSIHNFGLAIDIVDRWREYDINWDKLDKIAKYCGLEHDTDDLPHFEYRNGLTTAEMRTGKRPASLVLPCAIMHERAIAGKALTLKDLENCNAPEF